ncbi:MAG: zinc metalloprotease HtpX [Spirochaetes bacterium]|nr:zinc metalloprotease HtpX [Spirochaetota bacterium]
MFKTFLLLFALTALFILVGRMIAGRKGMIVAFAFACVMNVATYWFSDSLVLSAYNAEPVPAGHRLERVTHSLAREAGLPLPKAYIIPGSSPNAFATGRDPDHAAVAATEGLLAIMDDGELAGVMAHELGHVYNRDTLISTAAATISGGLLILSRMALFFGGSGRASTGKRIAVAVLAPIAATVVTMAISREREYAADEFSARLTGRPMYLASALLKLERGVQRSPMPDHSPQTAHLFIVHPFSADSIGEVFATHPPIKKRVERLKKMAGEM